MKLFHEIMHYAYIANYAHVLIHKRIKFSSQRRPPQFSSGSQSHPHLKILDPPLATVSRRVRSIDHS